MSNTATHARKIAKWLIQENEKGRPWRAIAKDFSKVVKPGTLNRIAKSKGEWTPKNKEILAALGLYKPRLPYPRPSWLFKWYRLPKDERHEVIRSHVDGTREDPHNEEQERKISEWLE